MISSNFNWGQDQADLLRRAAKVCPPLGGIRQNRVLRTRFVYFDGGALLCRPRRALITTGSASCPLATPKSRTRPTWHA